jgi:O-antigen polymerase
VQVIERESAASAPARARLPRAGSRAWVLGGMVLASTLAVDPWGLAAFGPLRWTLVAGGILAAAATLADRVLSIHRASTIMFAFLLGVLLLATVHAVDALHAWIGTPDRRLGWVAWLLFGLAFVCGQSLTGTPALRIVTRAAALAALGAGIYAVLELVGHAPVAVEFAAHRAGGPYGQPAYLGAAAALLAPIATGVALDHAERRAWRVVGASGAAFAGVALLAAQARAAWVGVAVAALVLLPRALRAVRARKLLAGGAALGLLVLVVLTPLGGRATSGADLADGTARGRIDEWRIALDAVRARPVLGAGPEGYRIVFPEVVDREYAQRYGRDVVTDRAHNSVLDVAVTGGLVATVAYVALLGFVLLAAGRAALRAPPLLAAVGAGVIAYALQQLFLFPLSEIEPVFWLFAGLLVVRTTPIYAHRRVRVSPVVLVPIALALVAVVGFGAREIAADHALRDATRATARGDHDAALAAADRATRLRPDSIRVWFADARTAEAGGTITDVDAAIARIDRGLDRAPRDPILRDERARLLLERAERSSRAPDRARALAALRALVADDPNHPDHQLQLGVALALDDQFAAAAGHFELAADLAPERAAPLIDLAAARERRGDLEGARDAAKEALGRDPHDPTARALVERLGAP